MFEDPILESHAMHDHDDDRRLNVVQLLALSVIIGLAAGVSAWVTGQGLMASLLIAWGGTIIGVFGVTLALFAYDALLERIGVKTARVETSEHQEMVEAWEADARLDRLQCRQAEEQDNLANGRPRAVRQGS